MAMAGLTWMKDVPFRDVYFNAIVRDAQGQKMSKTKGNVVNPLQSMDDYGTDALRFTLAIMAAPGTDIALSTSRLEASRNFCNKLWNAARFVQMNLTPDVTLDVEPAFGEAEYWIIRRIRECIGNVTRAIDAFRFHEAAETLYHLVWDDFCSTYIELAKINLQNGTTAQKAAILHFLDILLRSLHPFIPFVTEEIHEAVIQERLPEGEPALLAERSWPLNDPILSFDGGDPGLIPKFQEALSNILRLKAENSIDPAKRVPALCNLTELAAFAEAFKSLAKLESVAFQDGDLSSPTRAIAVIEGGLVALELAGVKDPAAERAKLEKERDKLTTELQALKARLANPDFLAKAAPKAIESQRQLAGEKEARLKVVLGVLEG
jgi:valyl-tRNA synthetase